MRAELSHSISVALPPDEAFPLFSPKGEEKWVPGWAPVYVSSETGEMCQEMIFITGAGDETTLWTCLDWQPEARRVRYLRTTPGSRVAFVDVACRPEGPSNTTIRVSYSFVALSEAGRNHIAEMTPRSFAAGIDEWAVLIGNYLAKKDAA